MNPLVAALSLIIHVIMDAYIIILLLRLILQKRNANWHNPISQFVIRLTEKPLIFFRKVIPGFRGFDLAILVFAFIVQLIELYLLALLQLKIAPNFLGLFVLAIGELASKVVYIYIYAIIINAILSWVPTLQSHPIAHIIHTIVYPILSRTQRLMPLISGIDLSPILVLLVLMLINLLFVNPLINVGEQLLL